MMLLESFGVEKIGAGSLTLMGPNTFDGDLNISAGTLRIIGDLQSIWEGRSDNRREQYLMSAGIQGTVDNAGPRI